MRGILLLGGVSGALFLGSCGSSAPTTCTNGCLTVGATQCSGTDVQTCAQDAHGCLGWGAAQACPSGQSCRAGSCFACTDLCPSAGATQCSGSQVQTCSVDTHGCLAWGAATDCPADAGAASCDATQQKCASACVNGCPQAGMTQCSGALVQTCSADAHGCLGWGAAAACPMNQTCDVAQQKCVDPCAPPSVQASCSSAADHVAACCEGGFPAPTALELCRAAVSLGYAPGLVCTVIASTPCTQLQSAAHQGMAPFGGPTCCCPAQQYCDLATADWACAPTCKSASDCSASAPACVPDVDGQGAIATKTMICKTNQAQAWMGCASAASICCPGGTACIRDAAGNQYCSPPCASTQPCAGDAGIACCSSVQACSCDAGCGSATHCTPCP